MTLRSCTLALLIALASMLLARAVHACDCIRPGPPCVAFTKTPVVFAGRVTQLSELRIPTGTGKNKYLVPYHLV